MGLPAVVPRARAPLEHGGVPHAPGGPLGLRTVRRNLLPPAGCNTSSAGALDLAVSSEPGMGLQSYTPARGTEGPQKGRVWRRALTV